MRDGAPRFRRATERNDTASDVRERTLLPGRNATPVMDRDAGAREARLSNGTIRLHTPGRPPVNMTAGAVTEQAPASPGSGGSVEATAMRASGLDAI